jgi:signal transduction histidine kinase
VPVRHEGRVVGVVQVMNDRQAYTQGHVEVVEALVGQMSAAVRNARLYEERSRAEAAAEAARAVAAEREQASRVLAAVGDGVVLVDHAGVVRLWNPAAARIIGLAAADVVGHEITAVLPGWRVVDDRLVGAEAELARKTLPVSVGDRELWLSVIGMPSADGMVYAFRDDTVEHALDQAKSDFVATVSHELRTPVTSIYGAAVTLERQDERLGDDARRRLISLISEQADRLVGVVEEIGLAGSLDTGRLELHEASFDLAEVVREAVGHAAHRAGGHVLLALHAAPDLPLARGDVRRARQIVTGLLDNAVKYSPEGGVVETVVDVSAARVRVAVRDQGLGIPAEEHERVFEKFYRLDADMKRGVGGTGLGLYVARRLAEQMGGSISLVSQPGRGSTFTLELPAAVAASEIPRMGD